MRFQLNKKKPVRSARLYMKQPLRPLLIRSPFLPDESLSSYLLRLSRLNEYASRTMVLQLAAEQAAPHSSEWFGAVATLTGQPDTALYAASYHRFAKVFQQYSFRSEKFTLSGGRSYAVLPKAIRRNHLLPDNDVSYCPLCLQEAPYHRQHWFPVTTAVCLEHQTLLVRGCPQCQQPIALHHLLDNKCARCGCLLSDAPTVTVAHDPFGLATQATLQSWWGHTPASRRYPPFPLPADDLFVLFSLVDGLRRAVVHARGFMTTFHDPGIYDKSYMERRKLNLTPVAYYTTVATAFKALVNWPKGFYEFLDAYRRRFNRQPTQDVQADFSSLYLGSLEKRWRTGAFDFAQIEFECFVGEHYTLSPSIIRLRRYQDDEDFRRVFSHLTLKTAADLLYVSPDTVKALIDGGLLAGIDPGQGRGKGRFILVDRDEVYALRRRWINGLTLAETTVFLGVSEAVTRDLIGLGLIKALRKPGELGASQWLLESYSASALLDRLRQVAQAEPAEKESLSGDWLSLTEAAQRLSAYGYTAAALIQSALQGEVAAQLTGPALHELRLVAADVERLRERLRQERAELSRQQIAEMLGVKPETIQRWIDRGFIRARTDSEGRVWVNQADWRDFRQAYLFSDEAAKMLQIGKLAVQKWARNGRLHPVCGGEGSDLHQYLFLRCDLEKLRPENRLTAPQLAAELGISRSQLGEWIKQGKVTPISGPEVDGMGHYLFLRSQMPTAG